MTMKSELSILIITYNRPEDTLELLQNLYKQNDWNSVLLEIILLNNASTQSYAIVENFIAQHPAFPIRYIPHNENLGVARGRNFLVERAQGQQLLVLDDDVIFDNEDALVTIAGLFQKPQFTQNNTAVITLNIHYFDSNERQLTAFPHKKKSKYADKEWFLTSYFIGAAHLMKRELFDKTGVYPTDFFYGMEEYDLGYRIIDAGYSIGYDASVKILHKESPLGRIPGKERQRSFWYNKAKVHWRYLPKKYFYSAALLWSFHYLKKTGGDLPGFFSVWKDIIRIPKYEKRNPISKYALEYLRKTEAQLLF